MNEDTYIDRAASRDRLIHDREELKKKITRDQKVLLSLEAEHKSDIKLFDHYDQMIKIIDESMNVDESRIEGDLKRFEEYIAEILGTSSTPMHIREIYERLVEMRIPIPGKGRLENVVARISRAKDMFAREGRGKYVFVGKSSYLYRQEKKDS